jgi:hypothetical protein
MKMRFVFPISFSLALCLLQSGGCSDGDKDQRGDGGSSQGDGPRLDQKPILGKEQGTNPKTDRGAPTLTPPSEVLAQAGVSMSTAEIVFLHHSTGWNIWDGGLGPWMEAYSNQDSKSFTITEREYPTDPPYGWNNYPYDYWNIWVNHAGDQRYLEQETLEIFTEQYQLIVFKHCFHVSEINADTGAPDISSDEKKLENYKLQYEALRAKMWQFPKTRFLLWTAAAHTQGNTDEETAKRTKSFVDWVKNEWDVPGDNIFLFDFYSLETEGGLYLNPSYATASDDSHPSGDFSKTVAPLLGQRIVNVLLAKGDSTSLTGK